MKHLCAILAFLVLTLSVQPVCVSAGTTVAQDCCSDSDCSGTEDQGDGEREECAHGNPFQLCGCCAFSVVPALRLSLRFSDKPVYTTYSWKMYACSDIEEPVLGFWQPPKIA